ncbi:MAG TPA: recombinase A [Kofleriaceae bacterium]|jgi:recombination protein RecA
MSDDLRELFAKAKGVAAIARQGWSQKASRRFEVAGAPCDLSVGTDEQPGAPGEPDRWGLDALRGRLVELSARGATATLTTAIELVLEAQQADEPVAWVTLGNATFYPPDVADSGVDLEALVVVRVHDIVAAARAAERLLRSGGFGLVVLDFAGTALDLPIAQPISFLGRLVTLAQTHDAAVVCITEKPNEAPSLGSLVSLRAEALRRHAPEAAESSSDRSYHVTLRALKDKRRGPGWSRTTKLRGPSGL